MTRWFTKPWSTTTQTTAKHHADLVGANWLRGC
jgi:hypothetical protein